MIKSDRKRIERALARWEFRYRESIENNRATPRETFAAAVDWLCGMVKLSSEMLDDTGLAWADDYLLDAQMLVVHQAGQLRDAIGEELKK